MHYPIGAVTGIGPLPFTDPRAAVEFSLAHCPQLAFVPILSSPDPLHTLITQSVVGLDGVWTDGDHALHVTPERLHPLSRVAPDLSHPSFDPLHAFVEAGRGYSGPIKWQLAGPLSVGLALMGHGVPTATAFGVAVRSVRATARVVQTHLAQAFPNSRQLVLLDEPRGSIIWCPGFPLAPDHAIDTLSASLAAIESLVDVGVHNRGVVDWGSLIAAGPGVVSLDIHVLDATLTPALQPFLERGGLVAWGVVPTDGPLRSSGLVYWRKVVETWNELASTGCDAQRLSTQALITPVGGLQDHSPAQAANAFRLANEVSQLLVEASSAGRGSGRPTHG